jgi:thiol-disulfide isomerase/thioredoxin
MRHALPSALLALALPLAAGAPDLAPFDAKSPAAIHRAYAGKPYVLAFWSVRCEPCVAEMGQWGELKKKYPGLAFVLVATDPPSDREAVNRILAKHPVTGIETFAFSDAFEERVRYAVDPKWRGELPRTYYFDASHKASAFSGAPMEWLEARLASGKAAR